MYCPVCGKWIEPENENDVLSGDHDGFVYVHDNINHSDSDLKALDSGVQ